MTKILHIITRLDMGGSAQNTLQTCHHLAHKYETILVHGLSAESKMSDEERLALENRIQQARQNGVRFICLPALVRRLSPVNDLKTIWALWKLFIRESPRIVHTHTSKAGILGRLAAWMAFVPHIVHTPHGHVFHGHFGRLFSKLFLYIERFFALFADRIIALTDGEKEDYIHLSVGKPEKLLTIHSGVDIEKFAGPGMDGAAKRKLLGLEPDAPVVGFVGWLEEIKGPMHLLQAMKIIWAAYPAATLVYVGKGSLETDLLAEASHLNLNGRVKFLGWREDVHEIMPLFDILVLPSLNEGMGRVIVEAMAAGKPVVASQVGGIPDLVSHGENGILVPPANPLALADAIKKLLDDPQMANLMGQIGRETCRSFSLDGMINKIDRLYAGLLEPSLKQEETTLDYLPQATETSSLHLKDTPSAGFNASIDGRKYPSSG
jgi:glycosyltransferase involved in cell wall biosynthesis